MKLNEIEMKHVFNLMFYSQFLFHTWFHLLIKINDDIYVRTADFSLFFQMMMSIVSGSRIAVKVYRCQRGICEKRIRKV